jgi:type VI protein secretion system component VasF
MLRRCIDELLLSTLHFAAPPTRAEDEEELAPKRSAVEARRGRVALALFIILSLVCCSFLGAGRFIRLKSEKKRKRIQIELDQHNGMDSPALSSS